MPKTLKRSAWTMLVELKIKVPVITRGAIRTFVNKTVICCRMNVNKPYI